LKKITKKNFKEMVKYNLIRFKKHKHDYKNYNQSKRYAYVEEDVFEEYNKILLNIKNT
jgi:hypothetical protein